MMHVRPSMAIACCEQVLSCSEHFCPTSVLIPGTPCGILRTSLVYPQGNPSTCSNDSGSRKRREGKPKKWAQFKYSSSDFITSLRCTKLGIMSNSILVNLRTMMIFPAQPPTVKAPLSSSTGMLTLRTMQRVFITTTFSGSTIDLTL